MKPETHKSGSPYNIHLRFSTGEKAVLKAIANTYGTTYTQVMRMAFYNFVNADYKTQNIRAVTLKNMPKQNEIGQMEKVEDEIQQMMIDIK